MIEHTDSTFFDSLHAAFQSGDINITDKSAEAENVHHVEELYRIITQQDFEALGEILTDDVVLEIVGSSDNPVAGKAQGRQQVIETTRRNFALLADQKPEIETVVAQGDTVVVVARERGRVVATDLTYDLRWVQLLKFKEGKLTHILELADSAGFREGTQS
jgi:ketosteroid isomerase-like protein